MTADPSAVRRNTYLLWVAHNLERIADRVTNIAERLAFVVTGDVEEFRNAILSRTVPD
jgi:phosphate transport system protein